ncbi:MAG: hypothetical protein ACKO4A_11985 [Gammaproteobacteria bacterium]
MILKDNPLANLKVLYGTGHLRLGNDGALAPAGGVDDSIEGGLVFDARSLRSDVRRMVAEQQGDAGSAPVWSCESMPDLHA